MKFLFCLFFVIPPAHFLHMNCMYVVIYYISSLKTKRKKIIFLFLKTAVPYVMPKSPIKKHYTYNYLFWNCNSPSPQNNHDSANFTLLQIHIKIHQVIPPHHHYTITIITFFVKIKKKYYLKNCIFSVWVCQNKKRNDQCCTGVAVDFYLCKGARNFFLEKFLNWARLILIFS